MTATNKLALELLQNAAANQTLANLTFAQLNQLVQASVQDKDLVAPPEAPADEALFIVGPAATGAWAGRDNQLAYWLASTGAWQFVNPKSGWTVAVIDEVDGNSQPLRYSFNGTVWGLSAGGGSGGGMTNPMTSIRDMIVAGVGGSPTRLPGPTSEGMVLTRIGNALAWAIATGFANPMTAPGDLITGGVAGAPARLGIGSAGQVLTVVSGALAWVTPSGGGGADPTKLPLAGGTMSGQINEAPIVDVIPGEEFADGRVDSGKPANTYRITSSGSGSFTGLYGSTKGSTRKIKFAIAGLVLVHSDTTFILPTGANITTQNGDWAEFTRIGQEAYENWWECTHYQRKDGTALKAVSDPTKVDKVEGLQLSQESYTTLEKTKLASLDPNHFRGMFATLAALQAAVPTANIGDYAFVDPASGADVIQYLWDNNDSKWVYNGPTAGVTAAQVKTLYESNPDTNAFTNAYKTKVDGIAAGAQVNTVTSVAGRTGAIVLAKGDVSLGNVENTADAAKPVSTAQQAALDLKLNAANPVASGIAIFGGPSQVLAGVITNYGDFTATRTTGNTAFNLNGPAGNQCRVAFYTNLSARWTFGKSNGAESGSNAGSDFWVSRFADDGSGVDVPVRIIRSTGETQTMSISASGPVKPGQYTLTTLPSASLYSGYEIDVTNATGGSKRCRSNGTVWQILNTTTTVS